jgi:hypothetical protein
MTKEWLVNITRTLTGLTSRKAVLGLVLALALLIGVAAPAGASAHPATIQPRSVECGSTKIVSDSGWDNFATYRIRSLLKQEYTVGGGNCNDWLSEVQVNAFSTTTFSYIVTCEYDNNTGACHYPAGASTGGTIPGGTTWIFDAASWKDFHAQDAGCHWQARATVNTFSLYSPTICA